MLLYSLKIGLRIASSSDASIKKWEIKCHQNRFVISVNEIGLKKCEQHSMVYPVLFKEVYVKAYEVKDYFHQTESDCCNLILNNRSKRFCFIITTHLSVLSLCFLNTIYEKMTFD